MNKHFFGFALIILMLIFCLGNMSAATASCSCGGSYSAGNCPGSLSASNCYTQNGTCYCQITCSSGRVPCECSTASQPECRNGSCFVSGETYGCGETQEFSANIHCFRQDIDRQFNMTPAYSISGGIDLPGTGKYEHIVSIGSRITFSNLNSQYEYTCDDSYSITATNFFALRDKIKGTIIKTNATDASSGEWRGPLSAGGSSPYCVDSSGNICYKIGPVFVPEMASCNRGGIYYGIGNAPEISYDLTAPGEYIFSLELGAISPANESPNASNILYRPVILNNGKSTVSIFVGSPNLIVLGQQNLKRINSFNDNGNSAEEVFFTVLNKSYLSATIKNYAIKCSNNVNCEIDAGSDGKPLYNGFRINPGGALMIPGKITIANNKRPLTFSASLDLNYAVAGLSDCDHLLDGNDCSTFSIPTQFNTGLLDQQNFQIEVSKATEVTNYCVGEDGVIGKTGPSVAPRINLFFGTSNPNETEPRISINECDKQLVSREENPNWVYCTQREFLTEIVEKIARIGEIRKGIANYEATGQLDRVTELRREENNVASFKSYLRAEDISRTKITESLNKIEAFQELATLIGFEKYSLSMNKVKKLVNEISFLQKTQNGVQVEETAIAPGLYNVNIEVNETGVNNFSEYLFAGEQLNPNLEFKVTLEKDSPPAFNWFFYEDDSTDDFAAKVMSMSDPSIPKYSANVLKRGTILEFERTGSRVDANFFYKTFAVPLFIELSTRKASSYTDANFAVLNYLLPGGIKPEMFSYWTGFASSLSDGCESTVVSRITGGKELPYRIPDFNIPAMNLYELSDFRSMASDSNLYLETVLYLPKTTNPLQEGIQLNAPFSIFTPKVSCKHSAAPCIVDINSNTPFIVSDLQSLFKSINDENVCVYKETGLNSGKWIIFWNQQKILREMDAKKNQITDAKICETRSRLSS